MTARDSLGISLRNQSDTENATPSSAAVPRKRPVSNVANVVGSRIARHLRRHRWRQGIERGLGDRIQRSDRFRVRRGELRRLRALSGFLLGCARATVSRSRFSAMPDVFQKAAISAGASARWKTAISSSLPCRRGAKLQHCGVRILRFRRAWISGRGTPSRCTRTGHHRARGPRSAIVWHAREPATLSSAAL